MLTVCMEIFGTVLPLCAQKRVKKKKEILLHFPSLSVNVLDWRLSCFLPNDTTACSYFILINPPHLHAMKTLYSAQSSLLHLCRPALVCFNRCIIHWNVQKCSSYTRWVNPGRQKLLNKGAKAKKKTTRKKDRSPTYTKWKVNLGEMGKVLRQER